MKYSARWIALSVGAVVVGLGIILAMQVGNDPRIGATKSQLVGQPAPELSLRALDGTTVDTNTLLGKAVIVNFWNSWCIPCRNELPALKEFANRYRDDPGVALVGIVRDDSTRAIKSYVKAEGIDWAIVTDPDSRAALDFATRGQPETFALDANGLITGAQIGPTTLRDLESLLGSAQGR